MKWKGRYWIGGKVGWEGEMGRYWIGWKVLDRMEGIG